MVRRSIGNGGLCSSLGLESTVCPSVLFYFEHYFEWLFAWDTRSVMEAEARSQGSHLPHLVVRCFTLGNVSSL